MALSFDEALEKVITRERRPRGKVWEWRRTLSPEDRASFDDAVDAHREVSTADLHRAVVQIGGEDIRYHHVYVYRDAVYLGAPR